MLGFLTTIGLLLVEKKCVFCSVTPQTHVCACVSRSFISFFIWQ